MALIIFKYCLPVLLGYTFFAGIAGQLLPVPRPKSIKSRPRWFLGLWTGVTISLLAIFGLDMAYKMGLNELPTLLKPSALVFAAALIPGFIGYFMYRFNVNRVTDEATEGQQIDTVSQYDALKIDSTQANANKSDTPEVANTKLDSTELNAIELSTIKLNARDLDATIAMPDSSILNESQLELEHRYSNWLTGLDKQLDDNPVFEDVQAFDENLLFDIDLVSANAALKTQVSNGAQPTVNEIASAGGIPATNKTTPTPTPTPTPTMVTETSQFSVETQDHIELDIEETIDLNAFEAEATHILNEFDIEATLDLRDLETDATLNLQRFENTHSNIRGTNVHGVHTNDNPPAIEQGYSSMTAIEQIQVTEISRLQIELDNNQRTIYQLEQDLAREKLRTWPKFKSIA